MDFLSAGKDFFEAFLCMVVTVRFGLSACERRLITRITVLMLFNTTCSHTLHCDGREHQRVGRDEHYKRCHRADEPGQKSSCPAVP